ncbi:MAG: tRNA lysidine(34) synthetase TilS [Chlamydiae bacterium CG10_big_fil_rev_8_21_14_0_10_35_9]|nr:MAG: tRNA lysidine(34) synthetase TilS [Chlamydiae bacterium CG10_big_fil_rev_8_21_14_0_10_35_9]
MDLKKIIITFLERYAESEKPIGLAFSGGSDSTCLLHVLHSLDSSFIKGLHVIHINHNWRPESSKQASYLHDKIQKMGYTFHRKDLEKPTSSSNMEDQARQLRLSFFHEIAEKHNLQGILLAHHKDDLTETILKRLFEGANFLNLGGIRPVQKIGTTTLLRPFLSVPKKEILEYLQSKSIDYLEDETNYSEKFLRGRFRKNILPFLSEHFGKNLMDNILLFQERADELYQYIDRKIARQLPRKEEGPFGVYYDFNASDLKDPLEWRYALLAICKENRYVFSKKLIDVIVQCLQESKANKWFEQNKIRLFCDRKILFFPKLQSPLLASSAALKIGKSNMHAMTIELKEAPYSRMKENTWKTLWLGNIRLYLPMGEYKLIPFEALQENDKKKFRKKWSDQKIPYFLREAFPLICKNGKDMQDLLSCKMIEVKKRTMLELSINFN